APGETYYGYGYYGPWSRNISTVNVNTVTVNRRYINAGVNNSVVVVQRDTFGTGRRISAKIAENPFTQPVQRSTANIAVVPPQSRPRQPIVIMPPEERERMRRQITERERAPREVQQPRQPAQPAVPQRPGAAPPAFVQHPQERQTPPPERFRKTQPEEIKNERRLVKEREASVFKPQPPENLPVRKMNEPRVINRKPAEEQKRDNRGEGRGRREERER
ncbi:MAG TPA: hypothetical protein VF903_03720, partial [Nitrospirota bacterium]